MLKMHRDAIIVAMNKSGKHDYITRRCTIAVMFWLREKIRSAPFFADRETHAGKIPDRATDS